LKTLLKLGFVYKASLEKTKTLLSIRKMSNPTEVTARLSEMMKKPGQMGGARSTRKVPAVGSKAQVWHGTAKHTSGGLTRKDLMKHKGRIVSRKKHALGKKAFKNLVKAGYKPKKGTFKLMGK
jgi:hypothetical protein